MDQIPCKSQEMFTF